MLLGHLSEVALTLCEDLNSPRSLAVALCVRYEAWNALVSLRAPEPTDVTFDLRRDQTWRYSDATFRGDVVTTDLLRKCAGLPTGVDLRGAAEALAAQVELTCEQTNSRIRAVLFEDALIDPLDEPVRAFFRRVKGRIHQVLRKPPDEMDLDIRFGPGSTFSDASPRNLVADKIQSSTSSRTNNLPLGCHLNWLASAWGRTWATDPTIRTMDPVVVRGNRFTTVPKDSTKDRGIGIEPSLNVSFQLALGKIIRSKLHRHANLDLIRGQELHKQLAREASVRGHLATLDLSNASDTICRELVRYLLPSGWWRLMSSLRSPLTEMRDGTWRYLSKFSSMGNGYTFELETLIFWAICSEVCASNGIPFSSGVNLSVYGDDMIVPVEASQGVLAALTWAGFSANPKKSFTRPNGRFRESCGGDYLSGVDVRPHQIKEIPHEPQHWISLANGLSRLGRANGHHFGSGSPFWRSWLRALDALPSHIRRLRGPVHLGDIVIHDVDFRFTGSVRVVDGCLQVKSYVPVRVLLGWDHWRPETVFACALYGLQSNSESDHVRVGGPEKLAAIIDSGGLTPRGGVVGFRPKWVGAGL